MGNLADQLVLEPYDGSFEHVSTLYHTMNDPTVIPTRATDPPKSFKDVEQFIRLCHGRYFWVLRLGADGPYVGYGSIGLETIVCPEIGTNIMKEYQGIGIGNRLYQILLDKLREMNYTQCKLYSKVDNQRTLHLATKYGFKEPAEPELHKTEKYGTYTTLYCNLYKVWKGVRP